MQPSSQKGRATAFNSGVSGGRVSAFSIVSSELAQVKSLIEEQLRNCSERVRELAEHIKIGGGKMIRPGLVLLSGRAFGELSEEHIYAAAIVEMIHSATLLHDDVVDEGRSRRGVATVNWLEGNESAVLLGDFLLSRVFRMCVCLDGHVAEKIASAAAQTCEGELRQIAERGNRGLGETEYIEIISQKTAALFEVACVLGGMLARADESRVQALADYGRKTGIAFQITDDVLDLIGEESEIGKPVGSDLGERNLTLPIIHLLRTAVEGDRTTVKRILDAPVPRETEAGINEWSLLAEKLRTHGSIEYAQKRAREFAGEAIAAIAKLRESDGKTALIEISRFVTERDA